MLLQNGKSRSEEKDLEGWSVDTSEEAVKSRMEKLTEGASVLALNNDLEKSSSERLDIFYKFVEVSVEIHTHDSDPLCVASVMGSFTM